MGGGVGIGNVGMSPAGVGWQEERAGKGGRWKEGEKGEAGISARRDGDAVLSSLESSKTLEQGWEGPQIPSH